jgi:uncharacterized membrane protein
MAPALLAVMHMPELVVVGFKNDRSRAAAVLSELRETDEPWTAELRGAIAAYRDERGQLTVDQSFEATKGGGAIGGALIGAVIGIALAVVALPLTSRLGEAVPTIALVLGGVAGVVLGARRGGYDRSWWSELDIPPDFLSMLQGIVMRNDSAIFILRNTPVHTDVARELARHFRPYGGSVLRTTLSSEQTAHVHHPVG